jgi:hypothetical protein
MSRLLPYLTPHGPGSCWQVTKRERTPSSPPAPPPSAVQTDYGSGEGDGASPQGGLERKFETQPFVCCLGSVTLTPLWPHLCLPRATFHAQRLAKGSHLGLQDPKNLGQGKTPQWSPSISAGDTRAQREGGLAPGKGLRRSETSDSVGGEGMRPRPIEASLPQTQ